MVAGGVPTWRAIRQRERSPAERCDRLAGSLVAWRGRVSTGSGPSGQKRIGTAVGCSRSRAAASSGRSTPLPCSRHSSTGRGSVLSGSTTYDTWFASLALSNGEDMGVASKLVGHSTVTITRDPYAHLVGDRAAIAVSRVAAMLWARRSVLTAATALLGNS